MNNQILTIYKMQEMATNYHINNNKEIIWKTDCSFPKDIMIIIIILTL